AEARREEVSRIQIMLDLHAEAVSKGHLGYSGGNTVTVKGVRGKYIALLHILVNFAVLLHDPRIIRKIICVSGGSQPYKFASRLLEFRSDHILKLSCIHRKGYQRRRNVDLVKRTGHTVLASDRGKAESDLRRVRAKQSRKRLAPALRILRHTAEVFLESKTDLAVVSSGSHDPGNGFRHRVRGSMVRAPGRKIRIKSVAHHGYGIGVSVQNSHF